MDMKRARKGSTNRTNNLLISVEAMSGPHGKNFLTRDPVHGMIEGTPGEKDIINSPLFQRLRRVGQLSLVNQVFNGGTHTRLEHSLGAMYIAGRYMTHIFRDPGIRELCKMYPPEHYIQLARITGLLHDIGHGPYSHSWDHVVGKAVYGVEDGGHDIHRLTLIESDIIAPYIRACGITTDELKTVWQANRSNKKDAWINASHDEGLERQLYHIIHAVVEGPLGADRMDFTLRDAKSTGTEHLGTIAHERIIESSRIVICGKGLEHPQLFLAYGNGALDDITRALDGRLCLYKNVYFHKTAMAASILIERIIEKCMEALDLEDVYQTPDQFALLDDESLTGLISSPLFNICPSVTRQSMSLSTGGIERLAQIQTDVEEARALTIRLKNRLLPKMVHEEMVFDFDTPYDEDEYRRRWFPRVPHKKYVIIKTRPIAAIDPRKFDKYSCCFFENGKAVSCKDALEKIRYTASQPPYYLVRGYEL